METITFSPAQVHVFNLMSHIKSALGLEQLREQLSAFYAKQVDEEMDALWESGQWDEKTMKEKLRRTIIGELLERLPPHRAVEKFIRFMDFAQQEKR